MMLKVSTFQERISELLNSDPRSLTAISHELGVSKQTVSAWKLGVRSPKKSVLIRIAEVFNVKIEWLLGFDVKPERILDEPKQTDDPEIRIVSGMMETMSQEQKQQVIDLVKILIKQIG